MYVSFIDDVVNMFCIKKYEWMHTCSALFHDDHKQASVKFLVQWIDSKVQQQLRYHFMHIVFDVKLKFSVEITYFKMFHVKELALEAIHETQNELRKTV